MIAVFGFFLFLFFFSLLWNWNWKEGEGSEKGNGFLSLYISSFRLILCFFFFFFSSSAFFLSPSPRFHASSFLQPNSNTCTSPISLVSLPLFVAHFNFSYPLITPYVSSLVFPSFALDSVPNVSMSRFSQSVIYPYT